MSGFLDGARQALGPVRPDLLAPIEQVTAVSRPGPKPTSIENDEMLVIRGAMRDRLDRAR